MRVGLATAACAIGALITAACTGGSRHDAHLSNATAPSGLFVEASPIATGSPTGSVAVGPGPRVEWRPVDPVTSVERASSAFAYVLDGHSDARMIFEPASAGSGAFVVGPDLQPPVVGADGRTVFIQWKKSTLGTDPLRWILNYSVPSGEQGSVSFPPETTSLTASLSSPGLYTISVTAFDGVTQGAGTVSQVRTFFVSLGLALPTAVVGLTGTTSGAVLTLRWNPPASGNNPMTYSVVFDGTTYPVGGSTSVSASVPPGRYSVEVFASNAVGDGPHTATDVSPVGAATLARYSGALSGSGQFDRGFGVLCTYTYSGTVTLTLGIEPSGNFTINPRGALSGTLNISGSEQTSPSPQITTILCPNQTTTFQGNSPTLGLVFSGTNLSGGTGTVSSAGAGFTFNGRLSDSSLTGVLTVGFTGNNNTIRLPVVLTR